jgi:hypothetical protein
MTTHHVYVHSQHGAEAIREGYSWPGFLLTWVWAFDKHLWKTGLGLLVLQLAMVGLIYAGLAANASLWVIGAVLVELLSRAFVGLSGSYWRENSMDRRGFVFEASVPAATPKEAIERALHSLAATPALARQADDRGRSWTVPAAVAAALLVLIFGAVWSGRDEPEPVAHRPAEEPATAAPTDQQQEPDPAPPTERRLTPSLARSQSESPTMRVLPATSAPATVAVPRPVTAAAAPVAQDSTAQGAAPAATTPPAGTDSGSERSPAAMESAWHRYYSPPANCVNPANWDDYVECTNHKIRAREAFENKWSAGQLR